MSLAAGTRLGPYEILSPLGAGGMGEVYRARDSRLERDIAIKVLPAHLAKDPEALARFEREAKAVAALSHPNILAIHDFRSEQGISFSVTELLEGETLGSRLALSPLPWRKAIEIAIAVAEGLSAAHSKGITHRDLKPENLFLTSDGRIKILDFGLARWRPYSDSTETELAVTDPGTIMGTVTYMSPEQVRGMQVDAPSDIFSLGCVLYEAIAGRKAFGRPSGPETMAAILREDPPALGDSGTKIPPDVDRLIQHCLEKNPQERFQSARDLAFALRALLTNSGSSRQVAPRSRKVIDSLAVLPFANTSADANVDYLSDGITENLINNLAQLPKLRIVPRSIVFRFKGKDVDPRGVGRDLGVRALLTGRVLLRGDTLNIQTELVDVVEQSQIWGAQYNRKFSDIFAVQEEIASEICDKLRVHLSSEQKKRLAKRHTQDTEAYQLYLKGRYYWNRRVPDKVHKAIELFQQAIDKDPRFAPAYAGLADSYASLGIYGALTPKESFPKLKAAAGKALELDESLAEAHASMAWARGFYDWDWAAAEAQFKRALELKMSYATAHHFYAFLLTAVGRFDEGVAESRRAQEIEPLSVVVNAGLSLAYYHARQYDQSILQAGKTIELEPTYGAAHFALGLAREQKGSLEEAIASFQRGAELLGGNARALAGLGHALAASGRTGEARKLLEELRQRSQQRYVAPAEFVPLCAGLGENDEAMEWLEKAYLDHSLWLAWVNADPRSDSLRHDPRFRDVMRRIGLQT